MKTLGSKIAVSKSLQIMELFRTLDTNMPIGEVVSFLTIAALETEDGGFTTVTELGLRGGFSLASASRHMRSLSIESRQGYAGHDVVTATVDPMDARRRLLSISPKGQRIIFNISRILET